MRAEIRGEAESVRAVAEQAFRHFCFLISQFPFLVHLFDVEQLEPMLTESWRIPMDEPLLSALASLARVLPKERKSRASVVSAPD